jgi:hypothetical protein
MLTRTNLPNPKIVFKNNENYLILKKNELFEIEIKKLEKEIDIIELNYLHLTDSEKLDYYNKKIKLRNLKIDSILNLKYLSKTFFNNSKAYLTLNIDISGVINSNKKILKELASERDEINLMTYEENIKLLKRKLK